MEKVEKLVLLLCHPAKTDRSWKNRERRQKQENKKKTIKILSKKEIISRGVTFARVEKLTCDCERVSSSRDRCYDLLRGN